MALLSYCKGAYCACQGQDRQTAAAAKVGTQAAVGSGNEVLQGSQHAAPKHQGLHAPPPLRGQSAPTPSCLLGGPGALTPPRPSGGPGLTPPFAPAASGTCARHGSRATAAAAQRGCCSAKLTACLSGLASQIKGLGRDHGTCTNGRKLWYE